MESYWAVVPTERQQLLCQETVAERPSENDVVQYHVLENDRDSERLMLRHIMLPSYLTGLVLASEFSNPCLKSRDSMV